SFIISSNSRMSLIEIAKKLKVDHKLVKYRMKKLEKNNIILAYVSSPNFDKLNLEFVQINISLNDPSIKNEIINYFNSTNKCLFALELLGRYDLSIEIHVENSLELKQIIDNFRKKFVNQYNEYDLLSITKEYVMVWSPFN
ncbi:MAG: winged helix-turn-helix transcriptional regulator, partial [Candidatus Thorarchaeota archaeon]